MSSRHGDELVGVYMGRLGAALAGVPGERRDEIIGEIASHIAEQRSALANESDHDVEEILARVGEPGELAAAATGEAPADRRTPRRIGAVEVLAVVLTPIVWPVGVILLWLSPAWSNRDRLIGTVLSLGGYPAIFVFVPALLLSPGLASYCTSSSTDGQSIQQSCTGVMALPDWEQLTIAVAMIAAVLVVLGLPLLVGIYLGVRLRRWASNPVLAAA